MSKEADLVREIERIFAEKISELKNGRKVLVPMDLRSYVVNEQAEREITDLRQLRKQVVASIWNQA
jgi:hypothetical protein